MTEGQRKFLEANPDPIVYQLQYNKRHAVKVWAPEQVRRNLAIAVYRQLTYTEAIEVTISEVTIPALRETAGTDHRVMEPWEIVSAARRPVWTFWSDRDQ